jgi:hypothetical protein
MPISPRPCEEIGAVYTAAPGRGLNPASTMGLDVVSP